MFQKSDRCSIILFSSKSTGFFFRALASFGFNGNLFKDSLPYEAKKPSHFHHLAAKASERPRTSE